MENKEKILDDLMASRYKIIQMSVALARKKKDFIPCTVNIKSNLNKTITYDLKSKEDKIPNLITVVKKLNFPDSIVVECEADTETLFSKKLEIEYKEDTLDEEDFEESKDEEIEDSENEDKELLKKLVEQNNALIEQNKELTNLQD